MAQTESPLFDDYDPLQYYAVFRSHEHDSDRLELTSATAVDAIIDAIEAYNSGECAQPADYIEVFQGDDAVVATISTRGLDV